MIKRRQVIVSVLLFLAISAAFLQCRQTDPLKEGDLIFQETDSEQGKAMKIATKSRYTHVGIIVRRKDGWFVFEAVGPVKITPLSEFIKRGVNRHFVIKRLKHHDAILTEANIMKLKSAAQGYLGKRYDFVFDWSDEKMYCSELVYKLFQRTLNVEVAPLEKAGDFDLTDPFVKKFLAKRFGKDFPAAETVLTVSTLFDSQELSEVLREN